jgi:hypothetical protein
MDGFLCVWRRDGVDFIPPLWVHDSGYILEMLFWMIVCPYLRYKLGCWVCALSGVGCGGRLRSELVDFDRGHTSLHYTLQQ